MRRSDSTRERPADESRSGQGVGDRITLGLLIVFAAFMCVLMGFLLIRSHVFDLSAAISDTQYQALWAFIASALATAATLLGLKFAKSHNERTLALQRDIEDRNDAARSEAEKRQTLDTVVRGLELLTTADGRYAVPARIAGSLAALVHLGHPVIAMRTLSAAWSEGKVDTATAVWLIGEVLRDPNTSRDSQVEAARLLLGHAANLCRTEEGQEGEFEWPQSLWSAWPQELPREARFDILFASTEVLLSRPKAWWGQRDGWVVVLLHEALTRDEDDVLAECAAHLLAALIDSYEPRAIRWPWNDGFKTLDDVEAAVEKHRSTGRCTVRTNTVAKKLDGWRQGQVQRSE
jgi:hypothetical protein